MSNTISKIQISLEEQLRIIYLSSILRNLEAQTDIDNKRALKEDDDVMSEESSVNDNENSSPILRI
jgi:hypothetical protein